MLALLLAAGFWILNSALAATHVTATYDLGSDPHVMTTVNGTPEYGLVFVQRNKLVTYNGVTSGASVVKGYLDASGQLNNGAGSAWLDLIPNVGATPPDSYYILTVNIQGRVQSEIWVVPDQPTVSADVCRQSSPPSSTAPALFYQFFQQNGNDLPQRAKLNFTGSGVNCLDNASELRTDCAFSGSGGGGSAPLASSTTSGTVKTDQTAADPMVYLKPSVDSLLGGKENALTFSLPISRSANTISCPTCALKVNKIVSLDVLSPTTAETNLVQHKFPNSVTLARISCSTDSGTVTIQFDERAESTPNAAGTNVMTSALVCDTVSEFAASFSNAGIAANAPLNMQITATSGAPNVVRVHVEYSVD